MTLRTMWRSKLTLNRWPCVECSGDGVVCVCWAVNMLWWCVCVVVVELPQVPEDDPQNC